MEVGEMICATCRFWVRHTFGPGGSPREMHGECRHSPPVVVSVQDDTPGDYEQPGWSRFPESRETDWCGQHQERSK
jgi:hypothetical protein